MCDSGKPIEQTVLCVKVTRPDIDDGRSSCIYRLHQFRAEDEFAGAELGDRISLEYIEMNEADLEALPEFEGW